MISQLCRSASASTRTPVQTSEKVRRGSSAVDRIGFRQHIVIDTRASPTSIQNAITSQGVGVNVAQTSIDLGEEDGALGIADLEAAPTVAQGKPTYNYSLALNHACNVDADCGILDDFSESKEWDKIALVRSRAEMRDPLDHVDAVTHSLSKTYQTIVKDIAHSRPGSSYSDAGYQGTRASVLVMIRCTSADAVPKLLPRKKTTHSKGTSCQFAPEPFLSLAGAHHTVQYTLDIV